MKKYIYLLLSLLTLHPTLAKQKIITSTIIASTLVLSHKRYNKKRSLRLHKAIEQNNITHALKFINNSQVDIHAKVDYGTGWISYKGSTPLIVCAQNGDKSLQIAQALLKHKYINVNLQSNNGTTPLIKCCIIGDGALKIAQALLGHKDINVNLQDNNGCTPLIWCAWKGDKSLKIAQELLGHKDINVNLQDILGWTPLIWCADEGDKSLKIAKALLKHQHINVNLPTKEGTTPLDKIIEQIQATKKNKENYTYVQLWNLLVAQGGILDKRKADYQNLKPSDFKEPQKGYVQAIKNNPPKCINNLLYKAIEQGNTTLAQNLINNPYVDVNAKTNGTTPLIQCCKTGDKSLHIAQELLKHQHINVNLQDNVGYTPLMLCCEQGDKSLKIAQALLGHKNINVNLQDNKGRTPLIRCAYTGDKSLKIAQELLGHKHINVNLQDKRGYTPLIWCCKTGDDALNIAQALLGHKHINVNLQDKLGWTPLIWCCKTGDGALKIAQALLGHQHINVNLPTNYGKTPLDTIIYWIKKNKENYKYVQLWNLLAAQGGILDKRKADYHNLKPSDFKEPQKTYVQAIKNNPPKNCINNVLYKAIEQGNTTLAQNLINNPYVDVNAKTNDSTPLIQCCRTGDKALPIAQALLGHKNINVNLQNNEGCTPLSWCCLNGDKALKIAQALLGHKNINVNLQNNDGCTPLIMCCQEGKKSLKIAQLLLQHKHININLQDNKGYTPLDTIIYWIKQNKEDYTYVQLWNLLAAQGGILDKCKADYENLKPSDFNEPQKNYVQAIKKNPFTRLPLVLQENERLTKQLEKLQKTSTQQLDDKTNTIQQKNETIKKHLYTISNLKYQCNKTIYRFDTFKQTIKQKAQSLQAETKKTITTLHTHKQKLEKERDTFKNTLHTTKQKIEQQNNTINDHLKAIHNQKNTIQHKEEQIQYFTNQLNTTKQPLQHEIPQDFLSQKYPMQNPLVALLTISNYATSPSKIPNLPLVIKDEEILQNIFQKKYHYTTLTPCKKINYTVNRKNFEKALKTIQTKIEDNHHDEKDKYDGLILVYNGHGQLNTALLSDGKTYSMTKICKKFDNRTLDFWLGKPRIIIKLACRGSDKGESISKNPNPRPQKETIWHCEDQDFISIYANTEGKIVQQSIDRKNNKGSAFVEAFDRLTNFDITFQKDLDQILKMLGNKVRKIMQGTECLEWKTTFFDTLYLTKNNQFNAEKQDNTLLNKEITILKHNFNEELSLNLCDAIDEQDYTLAQQLITNPQVNINIKDENGLTPLLWCCFDGDISLNITRLLLQHPHIQINVKDTYHKNPLHHTCAKGALKTLHLLIKQPTIHQIINQLDHQKNTPLDILFEHITGQHPDTTHVTAWSILVLEGALLNRHIQNYQQLHPSNFKNPQKTYIHLIKQNPPKN